MPSKRRKRKRPVYRKPRAFNLWILKLLTQGSWTWVELHPQIYDRFPLWLSPPEQWVSPKEALNRLIERGLIRELGELYRTTYKGVEYIKSKGDGA